MWKLLLVVTVVVTIGTRSTTGTHTPTDSAAPSPESGVPALSKSRSVTPSSSGPATPQTLYDASHRSVSVSRTVAASPAGSAAPLPSPTQGPTAQTPSLANSRSATPASTGQSSTTGASSPTGSAAHSPIPRRTPDRVTGKNKRSLSPPANCKRVRTNTQTGSFTSLVLPNQSNVLKDYTPIKPLVHYSRTDDKTFVVARHNSKHSYHRIIMYHLNVIEAQDQEDARDFGDDSRYSSYYAIFNEINAMRNLHGDAHAIQVEGVFIVHATLIIITAYEPGTCEHGDVPARGLAEILFGFGEIHRANVMQGAPYAHNIWIKNGHALIGDFSEAQLMDDSNAHAKSNSDFRQLAHSITRTVYPLVLNPPAPQNFIKLMEKTDFSTLDKLGKHEYFTSNHVVWADIVKNHGLASPPPFPEVSIEDAFKHDIHAREDDPISFDDFIADELPQIPEDMISYIIPLLDSKR